jgi:hypothetical protein
MFKKISPHPDPLPSRERESDMRISPYREGD